jgi:periplasmic divalent cation tolerance protein
MTDAILVYVTCPDPSTAEKIGRVAVEGRFAACAHIMPQHRSLYWWGGTLETAGENMLLLKTREDLFGPLEALIKVNHPYECPCIVAAPITQAHEPYLKWIEAETL